MRKISSNFIFNRNQKMPYEQILLLVRGPISQKLSQNQQEMSRKRNTLRNRLFNLNYKTKHNVDFHIIKKTVKPMKFLLLLTAASASLSQARHLQSDTYCDQWTTCVQHKMCWNNKCVTSTCSAESPCQAGFDCLEGKCVAQTQPANNGAYCDQWTQCADGQQCVNKKCAPLNCERYSDCAEGFQCYNQKCIWPQQHGQIQGYCDIYTPCASTHQCIDKKCYPLTCQMTLDCYSNFVCYDGFCIQTSSSHTRGRYCDPENECDILHQCVEHECRWK